MKRAICKSLIMAAILFTGALISCALVDAQGTGTVVVIETSEGTTDLSGTTTYPDGTSVTITATPNTGYVFSNWVISATDGHGDMFVVNNPATFSVSSNVTYTLTPVFILPTSIPGLTIPSDLGTAAIVVIYASAGGTTIPSPGTYALANAEAFNLTAMPYDGWQFSHWAISGTDVSHSSPVNWNPTDNPYNVNHGYGETYDYQAVFIPIGTAEPTPTPTSTSNASMDISASLWIIIGLVIVIIVILIIFGIYAYKKK
jgi:hypothetical protein